MREKPKNGEVLVIFSDSITRNRVAHIFKIARILLGLGRKPTILISRATVDAINDLIKDLPQNIKLLFLDSRKALASDAKGFLLKEWMLHLVQLFRLRNIVKKSDSVIVMGTLNLPAVIIARLHSKKVYAFAGGFAYLTQKAQSVDYRGRNVFKFIIAWITYLVEALVILLANYVIIESRSIRNHIPLYHVLQRILRSKVIDYGALFVDTQYFRPYIPVDKREEIVGYIGSLEHYRAVIELISAFRIIARLRAKTKFLVLGSGSLAGEINKIIGKDQILKSRIVLLGYIPHKDIPYYINQIKIFVFPTRSEGLPNTILEALASGCIVLATNVGGIPDIIKDDETGFIVRGELEPKNIAMHIISILSMPREKLIEISEKARTHVNYYFNFNSALSRWKRILRI
jgi:glycosyltransferase involved in cell wall biosynthesis